MNEKALPELLNPDDLFITYFGPWYGDSLPPDAQLQALPDVEQIELPEGVHISTLQPLPNEIQVKVARQLNSMKEAAEQDWPKSLDLSGDYSDEWLAAFQKHYNGEALRELLQRSAPNNFTNPFLIMCCELGACLGETLKRQRPELQWLYEFPYWDSSLFDLNSMTRINVFHWAVRAMSSEWENQSLPDKVKACLEFMN
jgi:hypothetical protein